MGSFDKYPTDEIYFVIIPSDRQKYRRTRSYFVLPLEESSLGLLLMRAPRLHSYTVHVCENVETWAWDRSRFTNAKKIIDVSSSGKFSYKPMMSMPTIECKITYL